MLVLLLIQRTTPCFSVNHNPTSMFYSKGYMIDIYIKDLVEGGYIPIVDHAHKLFLNIRLESVITMLINSHVATKVSSNAEFLGYFLSQQRHHFPHTMGGCLANATCTSDNDCYFNFTNEPNRDTSKSQ